MAGPRSIFPAAALASAASPPSNRVNTQLTVTPAATTSPAPVRKPRDAARGRSDEARKTATTSWVPATITTASGRTVRKFIARHPSGPSRLDTVESAAVHPPGRVLPPTTTRPASSAPSNARPAATTRVTT